MCPVCLATMGMIAGAVSSAGAATAWLFKNYRKKKPTKLSHVQQTIGGSGRQRSGV